MATFQSLGLCGDEHGIPREKLECNSYFSSMVLAVYDNILGPTILKIWTGRPINSQGDYAEPSFEKLQLITSYAIKDEAGREEKIMGIETKFYALEKMDIIACSYVFKAPLRGSKLGVFAFYVTIPYKELSEFMPRFSFCEDNVCHLLRKHLITKMENKKDERPSRMLVKDQIEEFLPDFKHKLQGLCQVMLSVRYDSLPSFIPIQNTFLGSELTDQNPKLKEFLTDALTCHLQLGGYTVVFGEVKESVNKMINTLALFLSDKERKISRSIGRRYVPNLYLQGYIKKEGALPFSLDYLWKNRFPSTIIDMDRYKVYFNESTVPVYLRRKDEGPAGPDKNIKALEELTNFDRGKEGRLIKEFVRQLMLLPESGGVREAFTYHFVHAMKLKAITICKYIEAELQSSTQQVELSPVLTVPSRMQEGAKVNKDMMMAELGLSVSHLDQLVILSFAEKMRPGSYIDVLGDPQKDIEHILIDLEFV